MANATDFKKHSQFSNVQSYVKRVYDFANDGGAIGVIDLIQLDDDTVIEDAYVKVLAAVTSAGAPTVQVGVKGGVANEILPATLKASLTLDAIIDGAAASNKKLVVAGGIISLEIKVAALTAGKIELVLVLGKK